MLSANLRRLPVLAVLILAAACASCTSGGSCCDVEWGYHGQIAPDHWADLSPCYKPCASGEQSPIDIAGATARTLPPLEFSYGAAPGLSSRNNGHTVQVDIPQGQNPSLRIAGVAYRLSQFHFHAPSEHTVRGSEAPIEMHLVHSGPGGRLAVVGVFIQEGTPNPELSKVWKDLPKKEGESRPVGTLDLPGLLPPDLASYRYAGSLTTPACGQGVQWNVLARSISLSRDQIQDFRNIFSGTEFPHGNRRPVQPLNGRELVTDVPRP